jgi:phytoene dehydrogenase-like protein
MVVEGGMGTVTRQLAQAAMEAGAVVETGRAVQQINVRGGSVSGVLLADGTEVGGQAMAASRPAGKQDAASH